VKKGTKIQEEYLMRTKATNFLQGAVLLTGVTYIIIGLSFFISPIGILEFFAANFPEDWLKQIMHDEIVAPLFYITRGFAALVFTSGAAMVLPLFDPLRYRGLIYYNALLFPFLITVLFLKNSLLQFLISSHPVQTSHSVILILGAVFSFLFLLNAAGLIMTKKIAKEGKE